ncbi:MAG: DUF1592 domain-containing protein [Myxococcota bacterium]
MARLLSVLLLLWACEGTIGEPESTLPAIEDPDWDPRPELPTAEECASRDVSVGRTALRRLTTAQLKNTFLDVLEIGALPASVEAKLLELPDGRDGGFDSTAGAPSTEVQRSYLSIAADLVPVVVADASRFVDCSLAEEACAAELFTALGRRLFRRSVTDDEIAEYTALYRAFLASDGANVATETALTAMLASPHLVYHAEPVWEDRRDGDTLALQPFALANRLSYFLWNSAPDAALLDAAERGDLDTEEGITAEVERMLGDSRTRRQLRNFYRQWLHLEGVEALIRDDEAWSPELRDKLIEEAFAFVEDVMTNGDHTLAELLTASHTIGDEEIAAHYGADAPGPDGRIELNPEHRTGILTHAGILAELGTVFPEIHRGAWIRSNFLCDPPPPPPGELELDPEVRRLETEPCQQCHIRMDPIGFGFAGFDSLGRFDAELASAAPQPTVNSPDGALDPSLVGTFNSPRELAERLAASPDVEDCVSMQWFRYAFGRWESEDDACAVVAMQEEFTRSGGDLHALAGALARSVAFRMRSTDALSGEER